MKSVNTPQDIRVSTVKVSGSIDSAVARAVELSRGLEEIFSPTDRVLLKANFNSHHRYPASSSLEFLAAVIRVLRNQGIKDITLGASSGLAWQPTAKVLKKKKVYSFAEDAGIPLVNFDEGRWVDIPVQGRHLKNISVAEAVIHADRIIYLPNMKTHVHARFSLGLKFAVGCTSPATRRALHRDHLEEKIIDINLAVRPDLIIMDARKCLVTGGPARGRKKKPGIIMASPDPVALDVEALRVLKSFKARNRLGMPPWEFPQIRAAKELKLGAGDPSDYRLISV